MKTGNSELKLEFTKYPFAQLDPVETVHGARIDSLRDVSANKLAALIDRFDPKDFVDLYFILQNTSLSLNYETRDLCVHGHPGIASSYVLVAFQR